MTKYLRLIFCLISVVLLLTGCLGGKDIAKEREVFAQGTSGEIVVGIVWPISELKAGTGFINGVKLAIEEINKNNGIRGRLLKARIEDEKSSFRDGILLAQSFAAQKNMVAVAGHWEPSITIPAAKIYNDAGMIMLSPAVSNNILTQKGYRYVFRNTLSDNEMGRQIAGYIKGRGYKRAVVFYEDDDYGRGVAKSFEDTFIEAGASIVDSVTEFSNTLEFNKAYKKWKALDYDVVFLVDSMPNAGVFLKRLREVDKEVPIFAADALDLDDLPAALGKAGEGLFVATTFNINEERAELKKFIAEYGKKYDVEPDTWAVQGYDSIKLIAYAIEQAKSTDPAKLEKVLHNTKNYHCVLGNISFDMEGNMTGKNISIKVIRNGSFQYIESR